MKLSLLAVLLPAALGAQTFSPQPATVMAGFGAPNVAVTGANARAALPCDATVATTNTAGYYYQRDAFPGARAWICALQSDGTTYLWENSGGAVRAATASIGGAVLLLGGSVSGTASVPNVPVGSVCLATPADGTFIDPTKFYVACAVQAAGTATVRVTAIVAATPPAAVYNVRVLP